MKKIMYNSAEFKDYLFNKMDEGDKVMTDLSFKQFVPLQGFSCEKGLSDGDSGTFVLFVTKKANSKRIESINRDIDTPEKESKKTFDMYSEYKERGLSPSDFI